MFCSNCGAENPAGAGFCARCGQTLGSAAPQGVATAPPAPFKPAGTQRTLGLMPLWLILTANIYWLFWAYKTYKEVRAHTPGATDITPGKAVGFLFIPFFNIFWFFRLMVDMPRAIRRMQQDDPLGEAPLNNGLVTALLMVGILGNTILGQVHPAFMLITEPLVIAGFVLAQSSLNAHWSRHAAGVAPGSISGPISAAPPQEVGLAGLLGLRRDPMPLAPAAALLAASWLSNLLVWFVAWPLTHHGDWPPLPFWIMSFALPLVMTACIVGAFRLVENEFAAAALAALSYSLLSPAARWLIARATQSVHVDLFSFLFSLFWGLIFIFSLTVALRFIQPTWLALWIGAGAANLLNMVASALLNWVHLGISGGPPLSAFLNPAGLASELVEATIFAFAFWGGLQLLAASDRVRA